MLSIVVGEHTTVNGVNKNFNKRVIIEYGKLPSAVADDPGSDHCIRLCLIRNPICRILIVPDGIQ